MARIQLVAFDNGVGNSKDHQLMQAALVSLGHQVSVRTISSHERRARRGAFRYWMYQLLKKVRACSEPGYDLNLFLEHVYPQALSDARANVFVPNPEWLDRHDVRWLSEITQLWCKTSNTVNRLANLAKPCLPLGFTSEDLYLPEVAKLPKFVHLAGKSRMKGTQRLLDLWSRQPNWPTLLVIHSGSVTFSAHGAKNIEVCREYLSQERLRHILNEHRFHLCLSETEGWGHYIPEAMSMQSVVITLDAPPMNEHVSQDAGVLINAQKFGQQHFANLYRLDEASLIQWVNTWLYDRADDKYQAMGERARERFLRQCQQFPKLLNERIYTLID